MLISPIIERLKATIPTLMPVFNNRIAGAADYAAVEDMARLALPSMYVLLGNDAANTLSNPSFLEEVEEQFTVIVVLDNQADRRGQSAQNQIHAIRAALFSAILNYQNDPDAHTIEYVGSRMLSMDKARYFHEFTFRQRIWLGEEDATQRSFDNFNKFYADYNLTTSDSLDQPDAQDHLDNLYNP